MFTTGLEVHQIAEVTNANFLALLFKSGCLLQGFAESLQHN